MAGSSETRALLRNVDERLQRVEQILPTSVTKEELRAEVAKPATKEELREESERTRRHMSVLFESLRDDVRIVAKGQVALAKRVDDIHRRLTGPAPRSR
jgi:uncharacterized protein YicC (UPF0701 family)